MAIQLPHIEDSNSTIYIPPKGNYTLFQDDAHYAEKVREWGLSTTKDVKKEFWYKESRYQRLVTIKGYETFGVTTEFNTLVIEFNDGHLSCIHPAYLKEMQSSSFGKELKTQIETPINNSEQTESSLKEEDEINANLPAEDTKGDVLAPTLSSTPKPTKTKQEKKEKPAKLVLPEEKVHFKGKVKQFALSWNHFNEENDEVVILEDVLIDLEEPIEVGLAWCAHSKTLKKYELTIGDTIEFDGKIVKKSLPKGKDVAEEAYRFEFSVPYKINNPSKIEKK